MNQVLSPASLLEAYPLRELMLFGFLCALIRLQENAQIEAELDPDNPTEVPKSKLIKGDPCNLTTSPKGPTLKSYSEIPDVAKFLNFPPEIREQLLRYGERWRAGLSR